MEGNQRENFTNDRKSTKVLQILKGKCLMEKGTEKRENIEALYERLKIKNTLYLQSTKTNTMFIGLAIMSKKQYLKMHNELIFHE